MKLRAYQTCLIGLCLSLPALDLSGGDWPQWRGPERTGWAAKDSPVPTTLPAEPKVLWRMTIGGGFSSPVIAGGKLVYLDAQEGREVAHLIDAGTGKEVWHVGFAQVFGDEWGAGPRSTPLIDENRVYVQACNGEFRCLNLADGKTIWGASFEKDFGVMFDGAQSRDGTASRRGNNGSGVIDGGQIILPVGGSQGASLVSFDKLTGAVRWKTGGDQAAYSSLMVATLAGTRQVVAFTAEALMGVEPVAGKLLWRVPFRTNAKRHAATPVIFGDNVIVNSHTIGLVCLKITSENGGQTARHAWVNTDLKINLATPVLADHYLYCQGAGNDYVCVDALTGRELWRQEGFGDKVSSTIGLGKNLLVLTDRGDLVLIAANNAKYTELGRAQVCGKTWSHPAYADGKLYVREGLDRGWKLTAFDLPPPGGPPTELR